MGHLTTHVLDTSAGLPAAGVRIELLRLDAAAPQAIVRIKMCIRDSPHIWVCRRVDIARHWMATHPFVGVA